MHPVVEDFKKDIPLARAIAAHEGTSHSPERRGASAVETYAIGLAGDYNMLASQADTEEKRAALPAEFARYREGMRVRTLAFLDAHSRCISTMITGPANFPVRRAEKANASADRRVKELIEFRKRALSAITKTMNPEQRPIMSGDVNAVDRLREKLDAAEALQGAMKDVNARIRQTAKQQHEQRIASLMTLGMDEATANRYLVPDSMGQIGYPPWKLTNNNANIKRMKDRMVAIMMAKRTAPAEIHGENATMEVNTADNRVRLAFPGKPDEETRSRLKAGGFKWTPSLSVWQAYINPRTKTLAAEIAGKKKEI